MLRAGDWAGFRSRFWTLLVRSDGAGELEPQPGAHAALGLTDERGRLSWRYTFYAGPLENAALTRADPRLGRLLFAGLWFWLRPLSFGLLFLLRGLTDLIGHPGAAIIALAVSVKILLLPLTGLAERLQEQVNATQARLQPGIDAIKAGYRGEERTRRTIALYREHGVHPLYTLKSLVGFMIQLPVFVAVFDMLAEDFDLQHVSFLWILDLSRPDALARLPACVPFFGCDLNLLPFLMSGVSLATLLRFRSSVLTPPLIRRQRRNLIAVTALFFLLFYTFPASMVLYWTSTNSFQLLSQELGRLWRRPGRSVLTS
jgi:YidC/Oxa1 family membrane protein insertase